MAIRGNGETGKRGNGGTGNSPCLFKSSNRDVGLAAESSEFQDPSLNYFDFNVQIYLKQDLTKTERILPHFPKLPKALQYQCFRNFPESFPRERILPRNHPVFA